MVTGRSWNIRRNGYGFGCWFWWRRYGQWCWRIGWGNVALGQAAESDFNNDYDQSFGGYPGADTGLGQGDFNTDFNDDFAVFHVGQVVSGKGESVGGNIATGVGSTVVFIPPVYPPPPPIPVQVWHPAQEYHRVQAPRATRVYRRGTELQRRPPQGMKRRYG
jgi:hypothetical protein